MKTVQIVFFEAEYKERVGLIDELADNNIKNYRMICGNGTITVSVAVQDTDALALFLSSKYAVRTIITEYPSPYVIRH